MSDEIVIPAPSDYHLHLRQGNTTRAVAPASAWAGRVLVMPNTDPPVLTAADVARYAVDCYEALGERTAVESTIKLTTETTPEVIRQAAECKVLAAKLYPAGVTTNSHDGIPADWLVNPVPQRFSDVLGEMERCGMVLCVHGEMPGKPTFFSGAVEFWLLTKSGAFLNWLIVGVLQKFPNLRAVIEHVSTAGEADWVRQNWNREPGRVAATVTPHHLVLTIEDLIGDKIRPHNFCKPVAKYEFDRDFLVGVVTTDHPAFFLGTDSAPHTIGSKECAEGCAGVFNAHAALGTVAEVFERAGALNRLAAFTSGRGDEFYRRPTAKRRIVLEKKPYTVPGAGAVRVPMPNGTDRQIRPWRSCEVLDWSWREVT